MPRRTRTDERVPLPPPAPAPDNSLGNAPGDDLLAKRIVERVVRTIGGERYRRYFDPHTHLRVAPDAVEVCVPSRFLAGLLDRRFGRTLRDAALAEAGGGAGSSVRFVVAPPLCSVAPPPALPPGRDAHAPGGSAAGPDQARRQARAGSAYRDHAPDSRYSLDRFVVGESNALAHNAAIMLAQAPPEDRSVSRLLLHGPCGVGKTHLLHGVAQRYRAMNPRGEIRVTSGDAFTSQFVTAVRSNRVDRFRATVRDVDLLCIDDVQVVAGKPATQTELLHTFDALDMGRARVVIVSDLHPRELASMNGSLVSRLTAWLVVRMGVPDRALRLRIVHDLAARRGLALEDAAAAIIADAADPQDPAHAGSVRDLEGMINRLEAIAHLDPGQLGPGGGVGAIIARRVVSRDQGRPASGPPRPIRLDRLVAEACALMAVSFDEFAGPSRHPRVVLARGLAAHASRTMTTHSLPEIARAMGRRTHSTVVSADQRFRRQLAADEAVPPALGLEHSAVSGLLRALHSRLKRTTQR